MDSQFASIWQQSTIESSAVVQHFQITWSKLEKKFKELIVAETIIIGIVFFSKQTLRS